MSQAVLEHLIHRFASQIRANGRLCLSSNGDPALVGAFKAVGWSDPHPIDADPVEAPAIEEAAAVEAPERAVMNAPKKRIG